MKRHVFNRKGTFLDTIIIKLESNDYNLTVYSYIHSLDIVIDIEHQLLLALQLKALERSDLSVNLKFMIYNNSKS